MCVVVNPLLALDIVEKVHSKDRVNEEKQEQQPCQNKNSKPEKKTAGLKKQNSRPEIAVTPRYTTHKRICATRARTHARTCECANTARLTAGGGHTQY